MGLGAAGLVVVKLTRRPNDTGLGVEGDRYYPQVGKLIDFSWENDFDSPKIDIPEVGGHVRQCTVSGLPFDEQPVKLPIRNHEDLKVIHAAVGDSYMWDQSGRPMVLLLMPASRPLLRATPEPSGVWLSGNRLCVFWQEPGTERKIRFGLGNEETSLDQNIEDWTARIAQAGSGEAASYRGPTMATGHSAPSAEMPAEQKPRSGKSKDLFEFILAFLGGWSLLGGILKAWIPVWLAVPIALLALIALRIAIKSVPALEFRLKRLRLLALPASKRWLIAIAGGCALLLGITLTLTLSQHESSPRAQATITFPSNGGIAREGLLRASGTVQDLQPGIAYCCSSNGTARIGI